MLVPADSQWGATLEDAIANINNIRWEYEPEREDFFIDLERAYPIIDSYEAEQQKSDIADYLQDQVRTMDESSFLNIATPAQVENFLSVMARIKTINESVAAINERRSGSDAIDRESVIESLMQYKDDKLRNKVITYLHEHAGEETLAAFDKDELQSVIMSMANLSHKYYHTFSTVQVTFGKARRLRQLISGFDFDDVMRSIHKISQSADASAFNLIYFIDKTVKDYGVEKTLRDNLKYAQVAGYDQPLANTLTFYSHQFNGKHDEIIELSMQAALDGTSKKNKMPRKRALIFAHGMAQVYYNPAISEQDEQFILDYTRNEVLFNKDVSIPTFRKYFHAGGNLKHRISVLKERMDERIKTTGQARRESI